jgi:hypothetical protein
MLSENAEELAKRYLLEELGIPAEAVKDAGKNLIGFFETLYNIDQRLKQPQPTI